MDELQRLYEHQTMMAIGIYSFLDNLLTHLPSTRNENNFENFSRSTQQRQHTTNITAATTSSISTNQSDSDQYSNGIIYNGTSVGDTFHVRNERTRTSLSSTTWALNDMNISNRSNSELPTSTQDYLIENVNSTCIQESVSKDIQPGGYPEEIFIYLSNSEKQEYSCSICYLIIKEVYQCQSQHKFCYGCIYTWSTGPTPGHDSCPVCRCDGLYAKNFDLDDRINRKRVRCTLNNCNWMGLLSVYNQHEHRRYSPYELDLLLADCRKDKLKSSTSLFPMSEQNQVAAYNDKEISVKLNDTSQINETIDASNRYLDNHGRDHQHGLDPGRVPVVCEPIDQSPEIPSGRLLTSQRRIRPLRNGNRQRHRLPSSSSQIQNRQILQIRSGVSQSQGSAAETRIHPSDNHNLLSVVNNSQGINNYVHSNLLQGEQQHQTLTYIQRQTQSHITSSATAHTNVTNTRQRSSPIVRDSRTHTNRFPNLRQSGGENTPLSIHSSEYENANNQTRGAYSLLDLDSYDIQSQDTLGVGDRTEINANGRNSNISRTVQVSLPAISFNQSLTCGLNTPPPINNTQRLQSFNLANNTISRTGQPLEFRRLVPQRQRKVVEQLRETREQLAAMLRLMTMELEERQNRVLNFNLEMSARNRLLRNPNNLHSNNREDSVAVHPDDTESHDFIELNNQNIFHSRHSRTTNTNGNDIQSNYQTYQSYNSSTPVSTITSINNNSSRNISRTLLTPTYRERTTTMNTEQNNSSNNQHGTIPAPMNSTSQSSASPLTSTARLLARLRLNALAQTTPFLFMSNHRSMNLNESDLGHTSPPTAATPLSSFMTSDSSNDENGGDSDDEEED
ncbi:unnamed protein product [Heterobilharzia americana]|nr:unnamed protein product [Heterobilharzia americana]